MLVSSTEHQGNNKILLAHAPVSETYFIVLLRWAEARQFEHTILVNQAATFPISERDVFYGCSVNTDIRLEVFLSD